MEGHWVPCILCDDKQFHMRTQMHSRAMTSASRRIEDDWIKILSVIESSSL